MKDHTRHPDGQPHGAPVRLRELRPGDLGEDAAWAVGLLREAPPQHRLKPGERQRVLLGLGRARAAGRRTWSVRLAAAVTVLVAATAIARAGLGHFPRWLSALAPASRPGTQAQAQVHVQIRPPAGVSHHRELAATPPPEIAAPSPEEATPAPPPPLPRATVNANRPPRRLAPPAQPKDGDAGLVVQAMRAFRHDGDPALARALCTAYLQRHPDGPLAEEALALTIEAAVAQHAPDAPALGARYLQRYPGGPFRGLARQASEPSGASPR